MVDHDRNIGIRSINIKTDTKSKKITLDILHHNLRNRLQSD